MIRRRRSLRSAGSNALAALAALAALMLAGALPSAAAEAPGAATPVPWPRLIAGAALGQAKGDLVRARPAAKPLDLLGEPEPAGRIDLLLEPLPAEAPFESIQYTFLDDRLCVVHLVLAGERAASLGERARIVRGAVGLFGGGYERLAAPPRVEGGKTRDVAAAALRWRSVERTVVVRFAAPASGGGARALPAGGAFADVLIAGTSCLAAPPLAPLAEDLSRLRAAARARYPELTAATSGSLFD